MLRSTGSYDIYLLKLDENGNFLWGVSLGGTGTEWQPYLDVDDFGTILLTGSYQGTADFDPNLGVFALTSVSPNDNDIFVVKLKQSSVVGLVHQDFNSNCHQDIGEYGLRNRTLLINPGNLVVQTNSSGFWGLDSLPAGNYTITADTSGSWIPTCPRSQSFTVVHPDSFTRAPSFGFLSLSACPMPDISIHAHF